MSVHEAKRFLAAVAADPTLADKASTAIKDKNSADGRRALSQLAGDAAYPFTPADLLELEHRGAEGLPLSEEDLDSVAGGGSFVIAQPEMQQASASSLGQIGQDNLASAPTMFVQPAANDEVSAAIAQLFGSHVQEYQSPSAQAEAFHQQFVSLLKP